MGDDEEGCVTAVRGGASVAWCCSAVPVIGVPFFLMMVWLCPCLGCTQQIRIRAANEEAVVRSEPSVAWSARESREPVLLILHAAHLTRLSATLHTTHLSVQCAQLPFIIDLTYPRRPIPV